MYKKLLFLMFVVLVLSLAGNVSAGGLMGEWNFDNQDANDSSGFGYDGVLEGNATLTWDAGGNGKPASWVLDVNADGWMDAGYIPQFDFGAGPMAFGCWVKCYYVDIIHQAFMCNNRNGFKMYRYSTSDPAIIRAKWNDLLPDDSLENPIEIGAGDPLSPLNNVWHHVVGMYDGATIYLIVDGQVNTKPATGEIRADPNNIVENPFFLGTQPESINDPNTTLKRAWRGRIDDVRVYDTDLSMDQIILWMNGGYPTFFKAMGPYPVNGAKDVPLNVVLDWRPGVNVGDVNGHDVYFGTDEAAVTDANTSTPVIYKGRYDVNGHDPFGAGDLAVQTTYFWRIDQINEADPNFWKGDVWSFKTIEYTDVIDDMESYTGTPGNEIHDTWDDHWVNSTGATVYLETTADNVHEDQQSMKLVYNNTVGLYYSELERRYKNPQKWLWYNPKALGLFFKGISDPPNAAEQMYLGLADTAHLDDPCVVMYDRPLSNLRKDDWQSWDIDLQDFTGVDLNDVNQIFIGFGDRSSPSQGGSGTIYIDDIRLYLSRCVPDRIPANFNSSSDCMVDSKDLDAMTESWLIPANYNLTTVAPNSNNLVNWWKFDEGTGATASDSGSAGNNGTLMSGFEPTWVAGMTGVPDDNALQFDGVDDGVGLTSALTIFSSSFTVSAWIKVPYSATGRVGIILGDYGLWAATNVNLELYGDGEIRFYWNASPNLLGSTDLRDDSWHLVTFVRDKAAEKVYGYIDGNPDFEYSGAIDDKTATTAHRIGRDARTGDTVFEGAIDDLRIYNYALSHAEVGYLALQGGTPLLVPMPPHAVKLDIVQDNKINLKDYAVLANGWLVEQTWP